MNDIDWVSCSLEDSLLRCEYFQGILPNSRHAVLKIRLIGELGSYRQSGSFDVASAHILAGLEAWQPWALVLDLQDLKYEWGDEMEGVLTAAHRWYEPVQPMRQVFAGGRLSQGFPTAVIMSTSNQEGLTSLLKASPKIDVVLCTSTQQALESLDHTLYGIPLI